MVIIKPADPRDADITDLLRQSHALMLSLFSTDDCHFLDIDTLCRDDIKFFAAYFNDTAIGTGAIKITPEYAEVKSMFTDPKQRGFGAAQAILSKLIDTSKHLGLSEIKLETGVGLDAAHALYAKNGFEICGPFGDYKASAASVFMRRTV